MKSIFFLLFNLISFLSYASFPMDKICLEKSQENTLEIYQSEDNIESKSQAAHKRYYIFSAVILAVVTIVLFSILLSALKCVDDRSKCNDSNSNSLSGVLVAMNILAILGIGIAIKGRKVQRDLNK